MPETPDLTEAALWAIRLFLGREPRDAAEVAHYAALGSLERLRAGMMRNPVARGEFHRIVRDLEGYRVPLFLLRPAEAAGPVPFLFTPPSLARPVSQLCTYGQFEEPDYAAWCAEMASVPGRRRKQWEFCWILAALSAGGMLRPGLRALGFGTGREVLPAVLAKRGLDVLATDAPAEGAFSARWAAAGMHGRQLMDLHRPEILDEASFARRVAWRAVDMNAIPEDLAGFDLCWSACALEHLGGIAAGLDFVANSLRCLRPGGLAVHTTEFNLSSDTDTVEEKGLCLFRRRDIAALAARLAAEGHEVWPVNLHPGDRPVDEVIDLPPPGDPHLKLFVGRFVTTSIGIAVRKRRA